MTSYPCFQTQPILRTIPRSAYSKTEATGTISYCSLLYNLAGHKMFQPIILSDEEDQNETARPFTGHSKKRRTEPDPNPAVFVVDDDPNPQKPSSASTPSFAPETPMSGLLNSDVAIVKCTKVSSHSDHISTASTSEPNRSSSYSTITSRNLVTVKIAGYATSENSGMDKCNENEKSLCLHLLGDSGWTSKFIGSRSSTDASLTEMSGDNSSNPTSHLDNHLVYDHLEKENISMEHEESAEKMNRAKVTEKKNNTSRVMRKTRMTKEKRMRIKEEKKLQKEQDKLKKAALKAEAAELKKIEKEKQKQEKGKFALKSIVAEIDVRVVESGSIGGHLLTWFAEKRLNYHIKSNPIEKSILWYMKVPEDIPQLSTERIEIPYVLLVYEADKFCNLVTDDSLLYHVSGIQSRYPHYRVCYLTNRLMAYVKRRKKLTQLSVNANGSLIPKDTIDQNLIKKSLWLKALAAIPKVQPWFAIAIWKKYPTMKSLLSAYIDPSKSEHEKEFLLKDLTTEGLLGYDGRIGEVCSKRVYRILMAQRENR